MVIPITKIFWREELWRDCQGRGQHKGRWFVLPSSSCFGMSKGCSIHPKTSQYPLGKIDFSLLTPLEGNHCHSQDKNFIGILSNAQTLPSPPASTSWSLTMERFGLEPLKPSQPSATSRVDKPRAALLPEKLPNSRKNEIPREQAALPRPTCRSDTHPCCC